MASAVGQLKALTAFSLDLYDRDNSIGPGPGAGGTAEAFSERVLCWCLEALPGGGHS